MKSIKWIAVLVVALAVLFLLVRTCKGVNPEEEGYEGSGDTISTNDILPINENDNYTGPPFEVYFLDQSSRPVDNGTPGQSYTAEVYIVDNIGKRVVGSWRGGTYPNSISNVDNRTNSNTVHVEMYTFNNLYGHKGSTVQGLNLIDDQQDRYTPGYDPMGVDVRMQYVNVHSGVSDRGNFNSRGSRGCLTLHPNDVGDFLNNFNFENGTTGTSTGVITVVRSSNEVLKDLKNDIQSLY